MVKNKLKINLQLTYKKTLIILGVGLIIGFKVYQYFSTVTAKKSINNALIELEGYQKNLQDYYQKNKFLPLPDQVFNKPNNTMSRSGCDIDGICPLYYERLLENNKRAFMAKTIISLDKPNRLFAGYIERDGKIIMYCGPWMYGHDESLTEDLLPEKCHTEIKKILGLR